MAGFININTKENGKIHSIGNVFGKIFNTQMYLLDILAEKPNYNVGSAVKLSFAKKESTNKSAAAVWKLTDEGDDNDLINEDDLLDENDKIKPNATDLKGKIKIFEHANEI